MTIITRVLSAAAMMAVGVVMVAGGGTVASGAEADDVERFDSGLASSPGSFPEVDILIEDLGDYINSDERETVPDIDGMPSGFAGLVASTEAPAVDIYWKGDVPPQVLSVLSHNSLVEVTLHPAEWNLSELIEARSQASEILLSSGVDTFAVTPRADARGLRIAFGAVSDKQAAELRITLESSIAVPIEFQEGGEVAVASRQSDSSPYSGGAGYKFHGSGGWNYCSSAAGVVGKSTGRNFLLTAFHCLNENKLATRSTSGDLRTCVHFR